MTLRLLKADMASLATTEPNKLKKLSKYVPVTQYPHLFPTIEAIEEGKVPSSLWEQSIVTEYVPLDVLLNPYYKYQDINAQV